MPSLSTPLTKRFDAWMRKRIPAASDVTLNQKKIFIFPSRAGLAFLLVLAGILLGAINYENNMLFGISFLLLSLLVVSILHTYSNLSGLNIKCGAAQPTFAGEPAQFEIILTRAGKRVYEGIRLKWPNADVVTTSLLEGKQKRVPLFLPSKRRGVMKTGRLLVETYYPVGLIRAWTWLDFDAQCLVYPKPIETNALVTASSEFNQQGQYLQQHGTDDFAGFKTYVPGDSLKQVAWKNAARGLPLMTKQFESQADKRIWIDWAQFDGQDIEQRLSQMCYLVLLAEQRKLEYGLRLPGIEFQPDLGVLHKLKSLQSLALFGLERQL